MSRRLAIVGITLVAAVATYVTASALSARRAAAGPAGAVIVFGPTQFNGSTGSGTTYVERFTVSPIPGNQYLLELDNGDSVGGHRVSSVAIKLNGHAVDNDDDLTSSVDTLILGIAVREVDTLRITVVGPAGSYVKAKVLSAVTSEYVINPPANYAITSGTTQTHTFSVTKDASAAPRFRIYAVHGDSLGGHRADSVKFKINGTSITGAAMTKAQGTMTKIVNFPQTTNSIQVTLWGPVNSFVTVRFTANDSMPPAFTITAPAANSVTSNNPVTVSGTLTDATPTGVKVNGVQATVTNSTSYSASVPLTSEGSNTLTIVATDAAALTTQQTRTVTRDTQVPTLTITAPLDNAVTKLASVTVSGTAADATALSVNTNGTPWTLGGGGAFGGSITLAVGANVLTTTATDAAGNTISVVRNVTRDTLPPALTVSAPVDATTTSSDSVVVSGTVTDQTAVTVAANGVNLPVSSGSFSGKIALAAGPNSIAVVATDAATNITTITRSVTREDEELPPDPSTMATTVDSTGINTLAGSTEFLFTGTDPIQTGVEPGTIEAMRAAVVRGRVVNMSGAALGGVQVAVLDHPEFGQTLSRADGRFDLAVNGGDEITLQFMKDGLLGVQRAVAVSWENYSETGDVAMAALDSQVTTVSFTQPTEVAQGSVVTDSAGSRQATLVFDQGTQASMVLPNGTTQSLSSVEVRATEFTRGTQGPTAMPGGLPATSAYTYAVELSVDDALAANARSVQFTKPVSFYVDNFLNIPTGARVPFGTYDRTAARWVPEKNGRVIKILSTSPVQIAASYPDTTTAAPQALLDSLGVSAAELTRLGNLYAVGKTLWRVELSHFTPGDLNFPFGWPAKAFAPKVSIHRPKLSCQHNEGGSIIGCEGQTLGEDIGIAGTPFTLHYQSDRTLGYLAERQIEIPAQTRVDTSLLMANRPLRFNEFPSHVLHIVYSLEVAGKTIIDPREPTGIVGATVLRWDGRDSYGRIINGAAKAKLSVGFAYSNNYGISTSGSADASGFGGLPESGSIARVSRDNGTLEQVWEGTLGSWDNRAGLALGGWSLSAHHVYDPISGTLYLGSGERRLASAIGNVAQVVPSTRGTFCGAFNCGTPIYTRYALGQIAVDASGNVMLPYVIDGSGPTAPGIIRVLGPGGTFVDSIPGGHPTAIAIAPDGTLYYSEQNGNQVQRRTPNGTTSVFAGTGVSGFQGDGGLATAARLNRPGAIAVGLDGSVFIADEDNNRIRRVATDGTISTYAGDGTTSFVADSALATATPAPAVKGLAVAADGTLIYASSNLVRRIDAGGRVSTLAGYNQPNGPGPTPARAMFFNTNVQAVAAEPDGGVLFAFPGKVYRTTLAGTLETVAGTGNGAGITRCIALIQAVVCNPLVPTEQEIASQTALEGLVGLAVGPDRTIYLAETSGNSSRAFVRTIRPGLPGLTPGNMLIASADGGEVYEFSALGRHLRTRDGITGRTLAVFDYDARGLLVALRDSLGNTTSIERDGAGNPEAIVAPFGQRTTLTLDGNGYLEEVRDPAGNKVELTHVASGLLTELRDPRNKVHRFVYDTVGRLVSDSAPNGGTKTLARTVRDSGYTVAVTTSMGRSTSYAVDALGDQTERRTMVDEAGLATRVYQSPSGIDSTATPDGTRVVVTRNSDPRFGPQVSFPGRMVVRLPSNDSSLIVSRRSAVRSDSTNPFALTQQIDSLTVNGRLWRTVYDAATQLSTSTTPEGRQFFTRLDSLGRVRSARTLGVDSVSYHYDSRDRLDQVQSGGRTWGYSYDSSGRLRSTLDPLGRRDSLFYDTAGRLTRRVLPGGREVFFAYDSSGNVTSVTPPGRTAHGFGYTPVDLTSGYTPPNVGLTTPATTYAYNADRQLTQITRPDSIAIGFGYDTAGRPSTVTFDRGQLTMGYSATTGQLTGLTAPGSNTLAYTYDGALPKTVTWGGTVQGSVGVSYDSDLRVSGMTVNGSNSLAFGYDADGLLTSAGALGIKRYAQHGLPERDSIGTVKTAWKYTPRAALAGDTATAGGSMLYATSYTRDSLDRITGFSETIGGTTSTSAFAYDSAGRLAEVTRGGVVTATYEYDLNGNRTRLTTPGGVMTGAYDAQDRLTQYGTTTYTYGSNGELKTKVEPGVGTTSYTYDALGNLTAATLPSGTALSYVIDGQNRRVGKRVNGTLVQGFLYQGQLSPVAELDGSNQVVSRFVYGIRANVPDYLIKGGVTYRIVADHLGSVRLVVNTANGTVAQRIDYDEFGRVTQNTAPGFQPFGFAGGLLDDHTGLVRFGARDYDPTTGRWTAKDPLGFAGGYANLYEYVDNDPVNYIDPTGLQSIRLPATPEGLPEGWQHDPGHLHPHGERWRGPNGDYLDFHQGQPGKPGWRGMDHWHHNGGDKHLLPGDEIPAPQPDGGALEQDLDKLGDACQSVIGWLDDFLRRLGPPPPWMLPPLLGPVPVFVP